MKSLFHLILSLAILTGMASACSSFDPEPSRDTVPGGVSFYTNVQGLTFFYVDTDGNDLVDNDERTSWPLAFPQKVELTVRESALQRASTTTTTDGRLYFIYNDNCNAISQDAETGLWGFTTYLWGRTVEPEYTMYVYAAGGLDSLQVAYTYLTASESNASGGSWSVRVDSVKYDGVEVLVGNENGKVFIQKPSREETVVKVGRL